MNARRTGGALSAAIVACTLLGCPAIHELAVSDTATSWLTVCASDADCVGTASCEQQLCTLACPGPGAPACAAIDSRATCEASPVDGFRCDLPCSATHECAVLGADSICSQGHCRHTRAPVADVSPPLDSRWATRTLTETTSFDVDLTGAALLSDLNLQASVPVAQWRGDHWSVVWSSPGTSFDGSPAEPRLYAASLTRAGHAERRAIPFSDQGPEPLQKGQDARVAHVVSAGSWWNLGDCRIELVDTAGLTVAPAFSFACGGEVAVTPLQGGEDWLVSWPDDDQSGGPTGTELMLARYRPSEARWVAGPWPVALGVPNGSLGVGTAGATAWVVWGEDTSTSAVAVPNVAGSVPAEPGPISSRRDLQLSSYEDSHPALVRSGPDALMFAADGTALVAVRLRADGSVGNPIALAPTSVIDRPPGVAAVPEHGLFGVCYPVRTGAGYGDGDRVALVTVDSAGALVGGPQVVAEGIENVGGCDVAWSGSELLVAWWDISLNAPRVNPLSSTLRARSLPLPSPMVPGRRTQRSVFPPFRIGSYSLPHTLLQPSS